MEVPRPPERRLTCSCRALDFASQQGRGYAGIANLNAIAVALKVCPRMEKKGPPCFTPSWP